METTASDEQPIKPLSALRRRFSRAVGKAKAAIFAERLLPRLLPPATVVGAFTAASWGGAWEYVPHEYRPIALAATALLTLASPFFVRNGSLLVSRKDAIRRLDRNIGDGTQPARMIASRLREDIPAESRELWERETEALIREWAEKFEAGGARPKISKTSAIAAALVALSLVGTGINARDQLVPRLQEAFNFEPPPPPVIPIQPPEVNVWVMPPENIEGTEALFLTNMSVDAAELSEGDLRAHEGSTLGASVYGGMPKITINGVPVEIEKELPPDREGRPGYEYIKTTLPEGEVTIAVENGPTWHITVKPDANPTATITEADDSRRYYRRLQIRCQAEDDNGIQEGRLEFHVPGQRDDAAEIPSAIIPSISMPGHSPCK